MSFFVVGTSESQKAAAARVSVVVVKVGLFSLPQPIPRNILSALVVPYC